jgi:hypothetical protein
LIRTRNVWSVGLKRRVASKITAATKWAFSKGLHGRFRTA